MGTLLGAAMKCRQIPGRRGSRAGRVGCNRRRGRGEKRSGGWCLVMDKPADDPRTRFETVLLQMREMILSGQLPAGSRVPETAIGERLGVSRTPVRLSLSVLEQEGLVYGEPNRGFVVREFTTEEVIAAYDVRAVLEGYACRIVAAKGLSPEDEQALQACVARGKELLALGHLDASTIRQ